MPDQPQAEEKKASSRLSVSFPENKAFELHTASFGETKDKEIERWLHETIRVYKESHDVLFMRHVPRWREIALGKPRDQTKSFPWPNASNLVIQVVGQRIDDISARVMGLVWQTSPVAIYRYFYKSGNPEHDQRKKTILEQFIDNVAYEPAELDLYRKENMWFADSAKLGTAFVKVYPDKRTNVNIVGYGSDSKKQIEFEETEAYNGPAVDNVKFEHVLADPKASTWEKSRLKCHIRTLSRHELDERAFTGFYDKDKVEAIRSKPDRHGPDQNTQRTQSKKGINQGQDSILAEWDVYECWFWYYIKMRKKEGGVQMVKVDLTFSYHFTSRTVLRQVFNFMPENQVPLIPTKLSIADEGVYGRGYADMLENSQDEVSTQHNQRIDARTIGITGILRTSNRNLDKNFGIYPSCIIPGEKDESEWLQAREPGDGGIADEELTLRLADERAGVGPAVAGMGAGQVNKKGQYGSMGTLAVMQDSNSRVNHRVSDFRHSHVKLISLCTMMYGKFGTGEKGSMFGMDDKILEEALSDFLSKKVRIPIRAATASANKEVEKQNDMLLRNSLSQHNVEQIKLLQAISQMGDPAVKKYMQDIVLSQDLMMKQTLRDFGFDNPDEFVPKMKFQEEQQNAPKAQGNGQPAPAALGMAPPVQQPEPGGGNGAGPGVPAVAGGLAEPSPSAR